MNLRRRNNRVDRELPTFLKAGLMRFNQRLLTTARRLQQKTNGYSTGKKKILLGLFVCIFITESGLVIVRSIKGENKTSIAVTRIKTIPVENGQSPDSLITRAEFQKIQKFKNYIDSLGATPEGVKLRDHLLHGRPGLMDSVNFLINLYLEQLKTK